MRHIFRRKSHVFLFCVAVSLLLFCAMFVHARFRESRDRELLRDMSKIVGKLELTDLCLFTEARYTRHPSMADRNTPFQDYPLSLEHFPSGSLLAPPPHLKPQARYGQTICN